MILRSEPDDHVSALNFVEHMVYDANARPFTSTAVGVLHVEEEVARHADDSTEVSLSGHEVFEVRVAVGSEFGAFMTWPMCIWSRSRRTVCSSSVELTRQVVR